MQSHINNIKLAIHLNKDVEVTLDAVKSSAVELALLKSGDRPVAQIALAYDESGKQKWISKDEAMVVIQHGRVVRTLGFKNDLLAVISDSQDPLKHVKEISGKRWQWLVDWEVGEYGYLVQAEYKVTQESLVLFDTHFPALKVTEAIDYKAEKSWINFHNNWENKYWFHAETGDLLKTIQKSAPYSDEFDMTYVSNAAKLL